MKYRIHTVAVVSVLLWTALPVWAHHSFAAEFDVDQVTTFTGVLTKVDWINPHVYFYVDVKDESGQTAHYTVETHPTGFLHRAGLKESDFTIGQTVTVEGWRAKDGTQHLVFMRGITFQDGRKIATSK